MNTNRPPLPGSRRAPLGVAAGFLVAAAATFLAAPAQAEPNAKMAEILKTYGAISPVPIQDTTPAVAKAAPTIASAVKIVMAKDGKSALVYHGTTKDFKIDVGEGHKVSARAYIPAGDGPFPTILYIHGGGWVIGSLEAYDASPRALAEMTKAVVISTDYRLAPADTFPTAHDDTFSAYKWVLANAGQYKGDTKKVAVVGESAGGNMAADICIEAKQQNVQEPIYQVLVYPVAGYDFNTKSYQDNETTKPLSAEGMKWFFKYYLAKPEDGNNPRINLLAQKDVSGVAPATIIAAEIDPLLTEGKGVRRQTRSGGREGPVQDVPGRDARILRHGRGARRGQAGRGVRGREFESGVCQVSGAAGTSAEHCAAVGAPCGGVSFVVKHSTHPFILMR